MRLVPRTHNSQTAPVSPKPSPKVVEGSRSFAGQKSAHTVNSAGALKEQG